MGELIDQKPVKLVASIIFKEEKDLVEAEKKLKRLYGPSESLEKILPFDYTDYYCEETGSPLMRKFLCFKRPLSLEKMSIIKIVTNKIEDSLRIKEKRAVNIDPGYITAAKLVLLTTKDYSHRVYIGRRIFAESTLFYKNGTFNAWPWTYPDYASKEIIEYFNKIRQLYIVN